MKPHRTRITVLITLLFALFGSPLAMAAQGSGNATIEVILIEASNNGSGTDRALSNYTGTLKRLFKFDSYRQLNRKNLKLSLPGSTNSSLGNGTQLTIEASLSGEKALLADLDWTSGNRSLLHTRLKLRPGKPAVLGGPRSKNGSYILMVLWK